jgi:hypothetical protein
MTVNECPTRVTVKVSSTDGLMRRIRWTLFGVRVTFWYVPPAPLGLMLTPLKRILSLGGGDPGKPGIPGVAGLVILIETASAP